MATDETAKEIESLLDELHELSRWGVRRGAYCKNDVNNLVFELNNIIDQLEVIEFEEDEDEYEEDEESVF